MSTIIWAMSYADVWIFRQKNLSILGPQIMPGHAVTCLILIKKRSYAHH